MGLTLTGLLRHCVISTFTEEEIWYKAKQSGLLTNEKFQPLPQGKSRVRLISDKPRKNKKPWTATYKAAPTGGPVGYRDHKWRERKKRLSEQEIKLRLRVEALARQERRIKGRIRKLRDETTLRRRDGRFASQDDVD